MKKIFIIFILLFLPLNSYADCFTGFACSVEDLQKQDIERQKQIINFINSYFDRHVKEFDYIKKNAENTDYRDIFIYYKNI